MINQNNYTLSKDNYIKWNNCIFIILVSIVLLTPVIFYRQGMNAFNPPKELFLQISTLLALAIWMLKLVYINKLEWKAGFLDIPVFLYMLFTCLSLVWSVNIYQSILSLPAFLIGPILYYLITNNINEQKKIDTIIMFIIIVSLGMAIYGILQYLGVDFDFWASARGRGGVFGLLGNVNYFAEYLILSLSLLVGLIISKHKKFNFYFLLIAGIIIGTAVIITFTRSSYLAMGVSISTTLLWYRKSNKKILEKKYLFRLLLSFLLILVIILIFISVARPVIQGKTPLTFLKSRINIESITSGHSALRRLATWKFTMMIIKDYPLIGTGLGTYIFNTFKYQADFFAIGNNRDIYPHGFAAQAHNEYLQLWSELGIIGLLLFLSIAFLFYKNILKTIKGIKEEEKAVVIGLTGGITAILVDAIFGFPLHLPASFSLFWIFLGLTNAQLIIAGNERIDSGYGIDKIEKDIKTGTKWPDRATIWKKIFLSILVVSFLAVTVSFLIRPFLSQIYWYKGNQEYLKDNYNEAIKIYEKGLKWNPWQGEMDYVIGNILASKNIHQTALDYYHKAEKFVDLHQLPYNIGISYFNLGNVQKAIPYLEKAIRYQQDKESMLPLQFELANIYSIRKDYSNAERMFKEIIQHNPGNAEAYYKLAGIYIIQDKKETAKTALEKVIEIAPEDKVAGYAKTMLTKLEIEP